MATASSGEWLCGTGGMAGRMQAFDWAATPLGPLSGWSATLRSFTAHVLDSPFPACLVWGCDMIALFNDAYAALAAEGADALGRPYRRVRAALWPALEPLALAALRGAPGRLADPAGGATLGLAPVRDPNGRVTGLIETVVAEPPALARALADATPDRIRTFAAIRDPSGAIAGFRPGLTGRAAVEAGPAAPDAEMVGRFRAVLASGATARSEERLDGGWFDRSIVPLGDGVLLVERDIGALRAAEAEIVRLAAKVEAQRLRESEARSRELVMGVAQAMWEADASGRIVADSPSWRAYTGQTLEEWLGEGWLDAIHPDDRDQVELRWRESVAAGGLVNSEFRLHHAASRAWRWTNVRAVPILAADGAIEKWVGMNIDVHDRRVAVEALRENEERLRSAVEVGRLGLWDWNVRTGEVAWSEEHFRMEGYEAGEIQPSYAAWIDRVHPEDRAGAEAALQAALASGTEFAHEFRSLHPDGAVRWLHGRGRFFYDAAGKPFRMVGAMLDTTEPREAAERQGILLAELQHRVRNILAVIHSMVRRSNDGERSTEDYVQHLEGRLSALARTQVLLTRRPGVGVEVEDIVRNELLVQVAHAGQFDLEGPGVMLAPKAAEVLSLAIHELATNATKYGAFLRRGGSLRVSWTVERRADGADGADWLSFVWRERGVPIVDAAPRRQGFGTELIERRVPYELKGRGSLHLHPGGMEGRIEFPLVAHASILETEGPDE